jgi:hypothetical protein
MQAALRRKLSMAARAADFAAAHPSNDASYTSLVARLQDRVTTATALSTQQAEGGVSERAAIAHRAQLRRDIDRIQLRHLVIAAQLAESEHPEVKGLFSYPRRHGPNRDFLAAAQAMAAAAVEQKDVFIALGLGDTFLDELNQALAAFEQATDDAHGARRSHVGAASQLRAVVNEAVKLVGMLDGLYRARFRNDAESLAAWESSRNLPGPFRGQQAPPAVAPTPTPTPTPVPAPQPLAQSQVTGQMPSVKPADGKEEGQS